MSYKVAHEAKKNLFPIYYRNCRRLRSTLKEDGNESEINKRLNLASLALADVQMKDFRKLRNEKLDSKKIQDFLDEIVEEIVDACG